MFVSEFHIGDLSSGQCRAITIIIYKSMIVKWKARLIGWASFKTRLDIGLQVNLTYWIGKLRPVTSPYVPEVISGHERPGQQFSAKTFDRYVLKQCKQLRCVLVDDTDRLICNMTFSGQVMTLTFGQSYKMTFYCQIIVHSTRLNKRSTVVATRMPCLS